MSQYPFSLDDDTTIYRVDDNITEINGENFNQLRDAIFKIESELGIKPSGTTSDLKTYLSVSHNNDGSIKASALSAVGLVTLPITNNQVGVNAGIKESKLSLDFSTAALHSSINALSTSISSLQSYSENTFTELNKHIAGGPETELRHVASQIDINALGTDPRDPNFTWNGLRDKDDELRSAEDVATALLQINDDLVGHEISTIDAHPASAISVDYTTFKEITSNATTVQLALEELDNLEGNRLGDHRASMHSNGIPVFAKSEAVKVFDTTSSQTTSADGYGLTVVMPRSVTTYVATYPTGIAPVDDVVNGDNIISFNTPSTSTEVYQLDSEFVKVKTGDVIRVSYGDGYNLETVHIVESVNFVPGTTWNVRIAGYNIYDQVEPTSARIDTSVIDNETSGVLAAAPANVSIFNGIGSVTIADPRVASTLGIDFDPSRIDSNHYNLYLQLYPTGNPFEKVITLPPVDITGNKGSTPGKYTLDSIVESANNAFRSPGYNYRFIAYKHNGNFGIALSDAINGAAFSISAFDKSLNPLVKSIVGTDYDALGFGPTKSNIASTEFRGTFSDSTDAIIKTNIIYPRKYRSFTASGTSKDSILRSIDDGYFEALITNRVQSGSNIETTYTVHSKKLSNIGLKAGKTITVQPTIDFNNSAYNDHDYGRFMIKSVSFVDVCPTCDEQTIITVVNGVHGAGTPISTGSVSGTVNIYFSNDTVSFDFNNISDGDTNLTQFNRLHDIHVNEYGQTFSHERARLPIQTGNDGEMITTNWHITDVSPKLTGYKTQSNIQDRFVRFYISEYNSISGEITGYIGNLGSGSTVTDAGNPVVIRKNIPTKLYTKSNNDYIELMYKEVNISSTNIEVGKYVDIQIFKGLELDKTYLLIASVELSNTYIGNIKDKRQFGSVSEFELTNSAKDYITSGQRALNSNGIIAGFECTSVSALNINSSNIIEFNGGQAFINGNVLPVNAQNIKIPNVYDVNTGLKPLFSVCVNSEGKLESIITTTSKSQAFIKEVGSVSNPYYVESVTFDELVSDRKDLAILGFTQITSDGYVFEDARKFITNQNDNSSFIWSEDGSFRTVTAVKKWLSKKSTKSNKVIIRGTVTVDNLPLDLTSIDREVIIEGEDATVIVNSDIGFKISSNVILNNIKFVYNPTTDPTDSWYVNANLTSPKGVVVISGSTNTKVTKPIITNCTFTDNNVDGYRHPFILGCFDNNYVNGLNISNNQFFDVGAKSCAAIVLTEKNITNVQNTRIDNSIIENNWCNGKQGIYLTSQRLADAGETSISGLFVSNVNIRNNTCGKIGFLTSDLPFKPSVISTSSITSKPLLNIKENTCDWIYTCQTDGYLSLGIIGGPSCNCGNVIIDGNVFAQLRINSFSDSNVIKRSTVEIINNTAIYSNVEPISFDLVDNDNDNPLTSDPVAICVFGLDPRQTDPRDSYGTTIISNNSVYSENLIDKYAKCIHIYGGNGIISNNIVSNWVWAGIVADCWNDSISITDNFLNRGNSTVGFFIFTVGNVIVDKNRFNSHLKNDSDLTSWNDTIGHITNADGITATIGKNINHEQELNLLLCSVPTLSANSGGVFYAPFKNFRNYSDISAIIPFAKKEPGGTFDLSINNTSTKKEVILSYNLSSIVPNSKITNFFMSCLCTAQGADNNSIATRLVDKTDTQYNYLINSFSTGGLGITNYTSDTIVNSDNSYFEISTIFTNGSGMAYVNIISLTIRYRY